MIVIREKTQGRKKYYEKLISKDGKSFDLIDTVIYSSHWSVKILNKTLVVTV